MKSLTLLITLSTLAISAVLSGPTPVSVPIEAYDGENSGRHIVTLEPNAARTSILSKVGSLLAGKQGMGITHEWDTILNGFAGRFDSETLAALQTTPGVASIAEDGIVHTSGVGITQTDAPWGLARLSSNRCLGCLDQQATHNYTYVPLMGQGSISTSSIRVSAPLMKTLGGEHGGGRLLVVTMIRTVMGTVHTARELLLGIDMALRKLPAFMRSSISGMQYAMNEAKRSGRPSVASMSLGGNANSAMDDAARNLVRSGVHVVVAAGNNNGDAKYKSPARVEEVITVGASTILDERASFSNFGSVVNVFAPGLNVIGTWNENDTTTKMLSGTSMATPHVAGLVAYFLSQNKTMTPFDMSQKVKGMSLDGLLNPFSLPKNTGTVNSVVNNGFPLLELPYVG